MTPLAHAAFAWGVAMAVLTGSIYGEAVVRRRRARKRAKLRQRLVVIDGGGAPVIQLRPPRGTVRAVMPR